MKNAVTYLHLVHDRGSDDQPTLRILEGMSSSRNGDTVLWCIHVSVNDVVFAAYKHTRRSIITVRSRELTTGYLHKQVGARVGRFAPFSYNVIETEVQFVVCQHLDARHHVQKQTGHCIKLELTFSALLNASPVGSWSDSE